MFPIKLSIVFILFAVLKFANAVPPESQISLNASSLQVTFSIPRTCSRITNPHSGVQLIQPQPGFREPFEVFCDQEYEGGGWIVIQNRYDGSVDFLRGWNDYEHGFGSIDDEMWLGLKKIHELTYSRKYELHVILEDWYGIQAIARYSNFLLAGPEQKYMLRSVGKFSGSAGDSLTPVNVGMKFSTIDNDNDIWDTVSCAIANNGGWWFRNCTDIEVGSNLNGIHKQGKSYTTINWNSFRREDYGLKKSRMKIRATT